LTTTGGKTDEARELRLVSCGEQEIGLVSEQYRSREDLEMALN
jgi:hypothetical protein